MSKIKWLILVLTLAVFGLIIFWPHLSYPFPFHVDEWHHLTEAKRLANPGEYFNWLQAEPGRATSGLEIGFQVLLLFLSKIFNIISIYKFLPALWAIFSGLALFFVAYQKSFKNFFLAWLALIFFMAIRTNANLTGLWFFTPLSFAFPFIFLYTYFLSEGILMANKKYLLSGFFIMLALLIFHPLSVLFSLPIFVIFVAINYRQVIKLKWIGLAGGIIIVAGIGFFALIFGENLFVALKHIISLLSFPRGWGVLELNNSLFELYPWPAWLWAIIGTIYLVHRDPRRYSFYLIWPAFLLGSTLFYRLVGISYFSPFQRNLYYLTLALPFLSGCGLYYFTQKTLPRWLTTWPNQKIASRVISGTLIIVTFFVIFVGYYNLPKQSLLYRVITPDDYATLQFLAKEPKTIVMGTPFIGTALVALTDHEPVGAINFYGQRQPVENFYLRGDCAEKRKIIESTGAKIVYWPKALKPLDCPWLKLVHNASSSKLFTVN
ncbi:MAG: hypothetical protein WC385_01835 [Candidatus Paceibacterota bacterium]|jgi:hypothetical protein